MKIKIQKSYVSAFVFIAILLLTFFTDSTSQATEENAILSNIF